jgi:hypothetical protein
LPAYLPIPSIVVYYAFLVSLFVHTHPESSHGAFFAPWKQFEQMSIKTSLTELLGIEKPIMLGSYKNKLKCDRAEKFTFSFCFVCFQLAWVELPQKN